MLERKEKTSAGRWPGSRNLSHFGNHSDGGVFFFYPTQQCLYTLRTSHMFFTPRKTKLPNYINAAPNVRTLPKRQKKNDKQRRRRTENASTTRETKRRVPVRPIIFSSGAGKEAAKSATSPTQPYRIVTLCRRLLGSAM